MIAGRAGYHTLLAFLGSKLRYFVVGTAELKGSGVLEILGFEIDV